jgi:hypothetical protein
MVQKTDGSRGESQDEEVVSPAWISGLRFGRRQGLRVYGGKVHWGRGFTGVEFPEAGGESLLESGLLTPGSRETSRR